MRVHVDVALDALLTVVSPRVARHPLSLTLGTLVLAKAALLALVRRFPFRLWACLRWNGIQSIVWRPLQLFPEPYLRTVAYVVALLEAQMAEIVYRRHLAVLAAIAVL